jgi:hypothetical protein
VGFAPVLGVENKELKGFANRRKAWLTGFKPFGPLFISKETNI